MPAPDTPEEILEFNRRYHDATAAEYDGKWGISFGAEGRAQVLGKVEKLLGPRPGPFGRSLEIGSGTGYFTLNLMQDGVIRSGVCTDVSPGMLEALSGNAERLGLAVETVACDAAALPFGDAEFDLILATDVLEHIPRDDVAARELRRVAAPGALLMVTVPAYQWLWSHHDDSHHHQRRYTLPALRSRLAGAGWRPVLQTYFNALLLPPIAAVRTFARGREGSDYELTEGPLNRVLELPMRAEAAAIGRGARFPAGVSIGMVCRPA